MKAKKTHIEFSKIESYLNGSLSSEEMSKMENDPFNKMALDGYVQQEGSVNSYKALDKKVKASLSGRRLSLFWGMGLGLIVIGLIVFLNFPEEIKSAKIVHVPNSKGEKTASVAPAKEMEEVSMSPKDIPDQSELSFVEVEKELEQPPSLIVAKPDSVKVTSVQEAKVVESKTDSIDPSLVFSAEKYLVTTKEYLFSTYLLAVPSQKRKTKRGESRFRQFNFFLKENELEKAVDVLESSVKIKSTKNKYLTEWVQALALLEKKEYALVKKKIAAIPELPTKLKDLKQELDKELIILMK